MKTCNQCIAEKALSEFYPNKTAKTGLAATCKACVIARQKARYSLQRVSISAREKRLRAIRSPAEIAARAVARAVRRQAHAEWLKSDDGLRALKEAAKTWRKNWYSRNKASVKLTGIARRKQSPDRARFYCRTYQQRKRQAVPSWANLDAISEWYFAASVAEKDTGFPWEVDHIVPLQHPLVCGLHCEFNLQILPQPDNRSKGNRYWPDMPT